VRERKREGGDNMLSTMWRRQAISAVALPALPYWLVLSTDLFLIIFA